MNDAERWEKINKIYRDFESKLEQHRKRVQVIVRETLRKLEKARADEILQSIKRKS